MAQVDAMLLQIMPTLQILLDKGNVTFNNNNNNNNNNNEDDDDDDEVSLKDTFQIFETKLTLQLMSYHAQI